jgi:hypothetical protein
MSKQWLLHPLLMLTLLLYPFKKIKFDNSYGHNRSSKVCSMTYWPFIKKKFIFQQHPLLPPMFFFHLLLPTIIETWLAIVTFSLSYVLGIGGTFSLSIVGWSKMLFHHLSNTIKTDKEMTKWTRFGYVSIACL